MRRQVRYLLANESNASFGKVINRPSSWVESVVSGVGLIHSPGPGLQRAIRATPWPMGEYLGRRSILKTVDTADFNVPRMWFTFVNFFPFRLT